MRVRDSNRDGAGFRSMSVYQLTEVLSSLRRPRTRSSLHPLLLALGRPGGEHGGLDGERRLPEILVFKCFISADPLGRAVRQEPETESRHGTNDEGTTNQGVRINSHNVDNITAQFQLDQ